MKRGRPVMLWYIFNSFMLQDLLASTFLNKPDNFRLLPGTALKRIIPPNPILPSGHDARGIRTIKPRSRPSKKLKRLLKKEFNSDVMSITEPNYRVTPLKYLNYSTDLEMKAAIEKVNITLSNNDDSPMEIEPKVLDAIKRWLVKKSSCPVQYHWQNLGDYFWPPWIRQGSCVDNGACSWPPGMHCVAAKSKTIKIFHWKCRDKPWRPQTKKPQSTSRKMKENTGRRRRKLRHRCKWEKTFYPFIDECFCSC